MQKRELIFEAPQQTPMVVNCLRSLSPGKYRLELVNHRPRRSDRQNRYLWPCVVVPFAEWLSEQQGERVSQETAHAILKDTFLRVPLTNANGEPLFDMRGDPMMQTRSSADLNTAEFAEYVDNCRNLMADLCGIVVPDPDPDYMLKPRKRATSNA